MESHSEIAVRLLDSWINGNISDCLAEIQSYTKIDSLLIVAHLSNIMGEYARESMIRSLRNRANVKPIIEQ